MAMHVFSELDVAPFADGRVFGSRGAYELVRALAEIRLEPADVANSTIVDLEHARRESDGTVKIISDVLILRPSDLAKGNGGLLAVVPNRGTTGGLPFTFGPRNLGGIGAELAPGDGWLLEQGWTLVWTGWQWEIPTGGATLGCDAPDVLDPIGDPIVGQVRIQLQPTAPRRSLRLNSSFDLFGVAARFYRAASLDQPRATLRFGMGRGALDSTVPRKDWTFARDLAGEPAPEPEHVWLKGGFSPDHCYEVCYLTDVCPMVGGGLAAFRDVASYLRHDTARYGFKFAVAVGWSQSGRFLRQFLLDGLNLDETGRPAFDAVVPFIAGASRGEFNHRYAQPCEALAPGLGHLPPFHLAGLLDRQTRVGGLPKVVTVNTGSEYWRANGSLADISLDGTHDLEPTDGTRSYYFAGTEHVGGAIMPPPFPADGRNWISVMASYRAILELVRRWIVDGVEPPASRVPRLADGTAVSREVVLARFAQLGVGPVPPPSRLAGRHALDMGPEAANGVPGYPARIGPAYPAFVSAVDADGNEIAGVRLPEVAIPLATHAPWNRLIAEGPRWDSLAVLAGNSYPFARHSAERIAGQDPRPAIDERYASRDHYAMQVRLAAERLREDGLLLACDLDTVVDEAERRYDDLMSPVTRASSV